VCAIDSLSNPRSLTPHTTPHHNTAHTRIWTNCEQPTRCIPSSGCANTAAEGMTRESVWQEQGGTDTGGWVGRGQMHGHLPSFRSMNNSVIFRSIYECSHSFYISRTGLYLGAIRLAFVKDPSVFFPNFFSGRKNSSSTHILLHKVYTCVSDVSLLT